MPRGIPNAPRLAPQPALLGPLELALSDVRVLLEARRAEYQTAADRISDILATLNPRPPVGRPRKTAA